MFPYLLVFEKLNFDLNFQFQGDKICVLVIQYGYVTLFAAAFPLAPLIAFLNNTFELRADAKKLFEQYRRPVALHYKSIEMWMTFMEYVGYVSVITNVSNITIGWGELSHWGGLA